MNLKTFSLALTATGALALSACSDRRDADDVVRTEPTPAQSETARETNEAVAATQESARDAWKEVKSATSEAYADAREAAREGLDELDDATFDERTTFRSRLDNMTSEIDEEIAELRQDGRELSAEARERLADAREELDESLDELSAASADTWDRAKAKVSEAWTNLQVAVRDTRNEVRAAE